MNFKKKLLSSTLVVFLASHSCYSIDIDWKSIAAGAVVSSPIFYVIGSYFKGKSMNDRQNQLEEDNRTIKLLRDDVIEQNRNLVNQINDQKQEINRLNQTVKQTHQTNENLNEKLALCKDFLDNFLNKAQGCLGYITDGKYNNSDVNLESGNSENTTQESGNVHENLASKSSEYINQESNEKSENLVSEKAESGNSVPLSQMENSRLENSKPGNLKPENLIPENKEFNQKSENNSLQNPENYR